MWVPVSRRDYTMPCPVIQIPEEIEFFNVELQSNSDVVDL